MAQAVLARNDSEIFDRQLICGVILPDELLLYAPNMSSCDFWNLLNRVLMGTTRWLRCGSSNSECAVVDIIEFRIVAVRAAWGDSSPTGVTSAIRWFNYDGSRRLNTNRQ